MRAAFALRQRCDTGRERRMADLHAQILREGRAWREEQATLKALDTLAEQCIADMQERGEL